MKPETTTLAVGLILVVLIVVAVGLFVAGVAERVVTALNDLDQLSGALK